MVLTTLLTKFTAKATRVIAIGIGPNVVGDELVTIASQPSDTNVYMTPSFEELSGVVGEILEKVTSFNCL